jgi:hypothetical protein
MESERRARDRGWPAAFDLRERTRGVPLGNKVESQTSISSLLSAFAKRTQHTHQWLLRLDAALRHSLTVSPQASGFPAVIVRRAALSALTRQVFPEQPAIYPVELGTQGSALGVRRNSISQ